MYLLICRLPESNNTFLLAPKNHSPSLPSSLLYLSLSQMLQKQVTSHSTPVTRNIVKTRSGHVVKPPNKLNL